MPGDTIQTYTNYIHVQLNVSATMIEALEEQTRLQARLDGVLEDRAEALKHSCFEVWKSVDLLRLFTT